MFTARNYDFELIPEGPTGTRELVLLSTLRVNPPLATLPLAQQALVTHTFDRSKTACFFIGSNTEEELSVHLLFSLHLGPGASLFLDLIPTASKWNPGISRDRLRRLLQTMRVASGCTHFRIWNSPFVLRNYVWRRWIPAARRAGFPIVLINGKQIFNPMEDGRVEDLVFYINRASLPLGIRQPEHEDKNYYYYKRRIDYLRDLGQQREGETEAHDLEEKLARSMWNMYYKTYAQEMPRMFPEGFPVSLQDFFARLPQNATEAQDWGGSHAALAILQTNQAEWMAYFARFPTKYPLLFAEAVLCRLRHWLSLF